MNRNLEALLALMLALSPLTAAALKSDADQPIHLESDSADLDDQTRTRTFTGNVVVTQGSIRVRADRLVVKELDAQTNHFRATGNPARFQQELDGKPGELVKGHADIIEYDSTSEFLYLIGNAFLIQEGDTVRTDRITYDKIRSVMKGGTSAKGKERVRMVIQSKKEQGD